MIRAIGSVPYSMKPRRRWGNQAVCSVYKVTLARRHVTLADDGVCRILIALQQSEATRLAEEVGKRTPYITVLFNNAGSAP